MRFLPPGPALCGLQLRVTKSDRLLSKQQACNMET